MEQKDNRMQEVTDMGAKGEILRNTMLFTAATMLSKIIVFAAMVFITRKLTIQELGYFDIGYTLQTIIIPVLWLSLPVVITLFISKSDNKKRTIASSTVTLMAMSLAASVIFFMAKSFVVLYLRIPEGLYDIVIVSAAALSLYTLVQQISQGDEKFKHWSLYTLSYSVAFAFLIFLLIPGMGYIGAFLAYTLAYTFPFALYLIKNRPSFDYDMQECAKLLKFSLMTGPMVLLFSIGCGLLRAKLFATSAASAGYLRILDTYGQLMIVPVIAFISIAYPVILRRYKEGLTKSSLFSLIRGYCVAFTLLAVFFGMNSKSFIQTLFRDRPELYPYITAYIIYLLAYGMYLVFNPLLFGIDKYHKKWMALQMVFGASLLAVTWGSESMDIMGVIAYTSTVYLLMSLLSMHIMNKDACITISDISRTAAYVVSAILAVSLVVSNNLGQIDTLLVSLVSLVLYTIIALKIRIITGDETRGIQECFGRYTHEI